MNIQLREKKFLVPIIIVGVMLLSSIGYLLYNIFGQHDNTTGIATSPSNTSSKNTTTSIKPNVVRIDLSSNASKNATGYNAAEQTGLSENQSVNLVRQQLVEIPAEYDIAFARIEVKDGKKYNVVKIYIKDHPKEVVSWCYVDPSTKKAYRLDEDNNKLYEIRRYKPNIKQTIIDSVDTNEVGE